MFNEEEEIDGKEKPCARTLFMRPGLMPEDDSPFIFHILANFVNKENSSYHGTYLKAKPSKLFGPQIFL